MLELTESLLLRRDDRIHADLKELKVIGVKLAIDDFGTGYSSLSYLRDLPIDVLKIDKSFVDGIGTSPQRLALVEGIVRIARTLNSRSSPRESKPKYSEICWSRWAASSARATCWRCRWKPIRRRRSCGSGGVWFPSFPA